MNCLFLQGKTYEEATITATKNSRLGKLTLMVQGRTKTEKGYNNDFFNCETWGNVTERLEKLDIKKGDIVLLRGCISAQKYNEKTYWKVTVDEIISVERAKKKTTTATPEGFTELEDEDCPF